VLACNTATARALDEVRDRASVPVLGVVRPGALAAAAATRSRAVGVIATAGTVESGAYRRAIEEADPTVHVTQLACPGLVPMVEAGMIEGRRAESVVRAYLEPLITAEAAMDTLLLGCTHYPLLRSQIERIVGERIAVVDSAFTTALAVEDLLDALDDRVPATGPPTRRVATTGDVAKFLSVAERLFGAGLPSIEAVDLEPVTVVPVD
jgi:glutamate racemase